MSIWVEHTKSDFDIPVDVDWGFKKLKDNEILSGYRR